MARGNADKMLTSRRGFLKAAGLAGAAGATTLWLPKIARGAGPSGAVKRVIILNAYGGIRWNASFDAQSDVQSNPWGLMSWALAMQGLPSNFSAAPQPQWGFSRMLMQKPLPMNSTNWAGNIYPYLSSDDAAHFNTTRPTLSAAWAGAYLPTFADIANETAVVRLTGNPGGQFDADHQSARHTLYTGYRSGQVGLATAVQAALQAQLGGGFDSFYPLPGVVTRDPTFGFGVGAYASARPMFLTSAATLPTTDPGHSVSAWGRKAETDLDSAFQGTRQAFMQQAIADFINDKAAGDAHVTQLVHPSLHIGVAPGTSSYGTLTDGVTPVTNDMLSEVFGVTSTLAPQGDVFFDCFAALDDTTTPTWKYTDNTYGQSAAVAVRLLQFGSPIVTLALGNYDSHSYEVIDPQRKQPQTVQVVMLARVMAGLEFALKRIVDPQDPTKSLWDSTVIFVCSEFGRASEQNDVGPNGFNSQNGANDGGSGHGSWCGWPILGGPVAGGGKLFVDTQNDGFFHQNRVFTTILKAMGVDDANSQYLPYGQFAPIPGLLQGV